VIVGVDWVDVIDLKYGFNPVEVEGNPQLLIYGAAALLHYPYAGDKGVRVHVYQPRIDNIAVVEYTREQLAAETARIKDAGRKALALYMRPETVKDSDFAPSESTCKYCPSSGRCAAQAEESFRGIGLDSPVEGEPKGRLLEGRKVAAILDGAGAIKQLLDATKDKAELMMQAGEEVPGYGLRAGRGSRKWAANLEGLMAQVPDAEEVMYDRKLLTVAQAEKVVDKALVAAYTVKVMGRPTLTKLKDSEKSDSTDIFDGFNSETGA
jgi:hypothetical protein